MTDHSHSLHIGWATTDLTPERPVSLQGQFHARVSEGVRDRLSATALAFESVRADSGARGVMVSCDLVSISDALRDLVREHVARDLPELDPTLVLLNATHTHTGPSTRKPVEAADGIGEGYGIDLDVMPIDAYVALAARRIADAVVQAWIGRRLGGLGFGLAHATIAYNRRMSYYTGETRMYGKPDDPEFSHVEGGSDATLNLLFTWDQHRKLTGVVVNVPCPSQISEHEYQISADYWCEAREELRAQLGEDVFILPQVSAAGDLCPGRPTTMIEWAGQQRMWKLMGTDQRRDTGRRIAAAVSAVLPYAEMQIDWNPPVAHRVEEVDITTRLLSQQDVDDALAEATKHETEYEALRRAIEADPAIRQQPRWYVPITRAYRRMQWNRGVAKRYAKQAERATRAIELHVIRLGDVALASNPFEYYLDFGLQIKARSKAVQTFIVQLAGSGSYLPTRRAAEGKSYGAVPASTAIGPEGGREIVNWTVAAINTLWSEPDRA